MSFEIFGAHDPRSFCNPFASAVRPSRRAAPVDVSAAAMPDRSAAIRPLLRHLLRSS